MIQRIAVTQRVIDNTTYSERRDGLAQDWADWLGEVFPHAALLAVPNRVDGLDAWFDVVDPEALVLTGGNDWGDAPERDATERRLVARARAARIPMLGVCRGMQALNIVFGGSVVVDLPNLTKVEHGYEVDVSYFQKHFKEDKRGRLSFHATVFLNLRQLIKEGLSL